jgi:hypothetical protein
VSVEGQGFFPDTLYLSGIAQLPKIGLPIVSGKISEK